MTASARRRLDPPGCLPAFLFLAGQSHPDHKTISSFRRRHRAAFGARFLHVLVLCQEAGLVKVGATSRSARLERSPGLRPNNAVGVEAGPPLELHEGPSGWVSPWHSGINQGPIIPMIEDHRTGLLWRLMRGCPYVVTGLQRAGFTGGWL